MFSGVTGFTSWLVVDLLKAAWAAGLIDSLGTDGVEPSSGCIRDGSPPETLKLMNVKTRTTKRHATQPRVSDLVDSFGSTVLNCEMLIAKVPDAFDVISSKSIASGSM
jgi:hypothetical protein